MVCCDTNFLIELMKQRPTAIAKLARIGSSGVSTTIINVAELLKGAYGRPNVNQAVAAVWSLLNNFTILNLDSSSCHHFGRLWVMLKSNRIGDADLFIASIAIANGEQLLTKNIKHFNRVAGLNIDTW
jgi:tRNA(fMet)-specific endonuclease VapC